MLVIVATRGAGPSDAFGALDGLLCTSCHVMALSKLNLVFYSFSINFEWFDPEHVEILQVLNYFSFSIIDFPLNCK